MPMTAREAARLVRKMGGRFGYHGAEHDIYYGPAGNAIPIPRHKGDLSPGTERSIKRALGLK